ncbi:MAG: zinc ribbon domain-containing protein, partial [Propionibacteriaceae bacterium]|nr:zinc ribbon domain-containing protein [Propionibacteriaceae bacterium]
MMMYTCVDGHISATSDFCDQCGLPVTLVDSPAPPTDTANAPLVVSGDQAPLPGGLTCPNCGATSPAAALFCEACGYDYTTGVLPDVDLSTELGLSPDPAAANSTAETVSASSAIISGDATPDILPPADQAVGANPDHLTDLPEPVPPHRPSLSRPWVAEVWIDPQWYAFQEANEPLPPQGPPRIIPLGERALIGRYSASRSIFPDIDCGSDSGCSRRQAFLSSADDHW